MSIKKTETLFSSKNKVDCKSKLNKLNKKVSQSILDKIEAGVTLENLDEISKSGLPILKYNTQITIHGLFDELQNNYIFGYKNIFQNKNKSIGVKYNAIDEAKRIRMQKRFKTIGLRYNRNSTSTCYSMQRSVNADNFESVKNELFKLKSNIDNSLFYGSVQIWKGSMYGQMYLIFDLTINAIYECNIETLLNSMGATIDKLNEVELNEKNEQAERELKYKAEAEKREQVRSKALKDSSKDLEILNKYNRVQKHSEPGLYLLRTFDYDDRLVYKIVDIYEMEGKKKSRYNKKEYDTLNDAMRHQRNQSYSDSIYNGRVTGYKIV